MVWNACKIALIKIVHWVEPLSVGKNRYNRKLLDLCDSWKFISPSKTVEGLDQNFKL